MKKIKYADIKHEAGFCKDAEGWCVDEIGNQHYFVNGYMESIDNEPASKYINKTFDWRKNGRYHRVDGPAKTTLSFDVYYLEGKKHRLDGPAMIDRSYENQWWINDFRLTEEEFNRLPRDDNAELHSMDIIEFRGVYSRTTFLFWHGQFCHSLEEFNARKLNQELPSKEMNKSRFKI